jgi:hypothetical protein
MVDEVLLRKAVDTAGSVYLATQRGVDSADCRRYPLERHLHGRSETHESDADELQWEGKPVDMGMDDIKIAGPFRNRL